MPRTLTAEQKKDYLEILEAGILPTLACLQLGISFNVVWNTLQRSKKFKAAYEKAKAAGLGQKLEETLFKLADGEATTETTHYRPVKDEDGKMVYNEDGTQKMEVFSRKSTRLAPDQKSLIEWLRHSRPGDWSNDPAGPSVDDLTPEQVKQALADFLPPDSPPDGKSGQDDLLTE